MNVRTMAPSWYDPRQPWSTALSVVRGQAGQGVVGTSPNAAGGVVGAKPRQKAFGDQGVALDPPRGDPLEPVLLCGSRGVASLSRGADAREKGLFSLGWRLCASPELGKEALAGSSGSREIGFDRSERWKPGESRLNLLTSFEPSIG